MILDCCFAASAGAGAGAGIGVKVFGLRETVHLVVIIVATQTALTKLDMTDSIATSYVKDCAQQSKTSISQLVGEDISD